MTRVRCLVADDHPPLVAALERLLSDNGFEVVGPVADGKAAVEAATVAQPELAVVDYRMPGYSGPDLLAELNRVSPNTRLVVFTGHAEPGFVAEAVGSGAAGIVLKEAPLADLLRALTIVSAGRSYIDASLGETSAAAELRGRELETVRLLADGLTHDQIGKRLSISPETVRIHLRNASARLGTSTRTHLVATALRRGLID
jgi:DNA-binding NarL/FixJ family response regulator